MVERKYPIINQISKEVRKNIFDLLQIEMIAYNGDLTEIDFLSRVFDLEKLPSDDRRFQDSFGDIWQHRIMNPEDWPDNWIFTDHRFNLLNCDDDTFLGFLCEMIHPLVRRNIEQCKYLENIFNDLLNPVGFEVIETTSLNGHPIFAGRKILFSRPIGLDLVKNNEDFSSTYIRNQISRIESAIETDPDLAIGTSKELVETCCKSILKDQNIDFQEDWEIPKLVKVTFQQLRISPEEIPQTAKASETIKRMLSNLGTLVQGLAELRNHYGTGHGKVSSSKGLSARHAKLAAGAATTLAIFLFETHREKKGKSN